MKAYLCKISGEIVPVAYLSLSSLCNNTGINYFSAIRGQRVFKDKEIIEISVIKRGKRGKSVT